MAIPEVGALGIIVSLLCGSGALAFFFKYGVRLALVEAKADKTSKDSEQHGKELSATNAQVQLLDAAVHDIRKSLSKLDGLDTVVATVAAMKESLSDKFQALVPRSEHIARWQASDLLMGEMKTEMTEIRKAVLKMQVHKSSE